MEDWKDIIGFDGRYSISNAGLVKSHKRSVHYKDGKYRFISERFLTPDIDGDGYARIRLHANGVEKKYKIHRLVATAFLGESNLTVNHKNGIKTDNRVENLEWCTRSENMRHAVDTGLLVRSKGEDSSNGKLTNQQALEIRNKYIPRLYTMEKIAHEYGVSAHIIWRIVRNKTYKNLALTQNGDLECLS